MFLVNTSPTLSVQFAPDGNPDSVGSDVTVTVTRSNGEAIATAAATTPAGSGATARYDWNLPVASNNRPDLLRLDWLDVSSGQTVTTWAEIVGSLLVSEAAVRAYRIGTGEQIFSDTTEYPDSLIMGWRRTVTDIFEQRTGQSFIERCARVELSGHGSARLDLRHAQCRRADGVPLNRPGRHGQIIRFLAAQATGVTVPVADLVADGSVVYNKAATWTRASWTDPLNVTIEYTYGHTYPDPEAQQRALDLIAANMVPGDYPSRATSINNEDGTFRISTWPVAVEDFIRARDVRVALG